MNARGEIDIPSKYKLHAIKRNKTLRARDKKVQVKASTTPYIAGCS